MPAFMKRTLLVILYIAFFACAIKAQQPHNITGVVTDEKDQPIPGATVFLGDSRKATATDANGNFTLNKVQPGKYS